jgi:hypothetical protein
MKGSSTSTPREKAFPQTPAVGLMSFNRPAQALGLGVLTSRPGLQSSRQSIKRFSSWQRGAHRPPRLLGERCFREWIFRE